MPQQSEEPFDSIESAYDFLRILSQAVAEARRDIEGEILEGEIRRESTSQSSRRFDALRVACYSVEKLEFHVSRCRRILNDLRSLRRLLFEERAAPRATTKPERVETLVPETPVTIPRMPAAPVPAPLSPPVVRRGGKAGSAVAA